MTHFAVRTTVALWSIGFAGVGPAVLSRRRLACLDCQAGLDISDYPLIDGKHMLLTAIRPVCQSADTLLDAKWSTISLVFNIAQHCAKL